MYGSVWDLGEREAKEGREAKGGKEEKQPKEGKEEAFTIEMAPISEMPHAVLHFLEQVDHGLWDSAWFYLNGPHVLQAGPQADEGDDGYDDHGDDREFALRRFRELEFEGAIWRGFSFAELALPCFILLAVGAVGMVVGTALLRRS